MLARAVQCPCRGVRQSRLLMVLRDIMVMRLARRQKWAHSRTSADVALAFVAFWSFCLTNLPVRVGGKLVGQYAGPTYLHDSQPDQPTSLVRTELVGHRKGAVQKPIISSSAHWRAGQRCWGAAHGPEALAAPCRSTASSRLS